MGTQNSAERPSEPDADDLTSESSTSRESTVADDSRAKVTPKLEKVTPSAGSRPSTAAHAASASQLSGTPANPTQALSASQPPSILYGHQWPEFLCDKVEILIRESVAEGDKTEDNWDVISHRLRERYGFERSASGIKNYWARRGRAKYGIDERRKPKPETMATSLKTPQTRRAARKREELVRSRHEDAVTAPIVAMNPHPSFFSYQQRPEFAIASPVGSGFAHGLYGPTKHLKNDANAAESNFDNGDQSESRPYGTTRNMNLGTRDQSASQDFKDEETDAAPRKRLDGDLQNHAHKTVVNRDRWEKMNRKRPEKANRTMPLKAKQSPETPKKDGRQLANRAKNIASSSNILFPGLMKYVDPSSLNEDLDRKIIGKSQHADITKVTKPRNVINTSACDLALRSTPPAKAQMPKDDDSLTIGDGIRRSGRVRKTRHWGDEIYEVRPSKQARRKSAA